MRPRTGEVLHFSEDPALTVFDPHVARTAEEATPYVWAVDASRAPDYWFPRECPRAMAWSLATTDAEDRAVVLGPSADRVHVIEYRWLPALRTTRLYAYRFAAQDFEPVGEPVYAHVSRHSVRPLGPPEPVGDLIAVHEAEGIELRIVASLWPFVDLAQRRSVGFSAIRLHNARAR